MTRKFQYNTASTVYMKKFPEVSGKTDGGKLMVTAY